MRLLSSRAQTWLAFAGILLGYITLFIDAGGTSLAPGDMVRDFQGDIEKVKWGTNATDLVIVMSALAIGRCADLLGRKPILLLGLAFFSGGELLCSLAPDFDVLIGARVLQGLGAAAISSTGLALAFALFDPEERGP